MKTRRLLILSLVVVALLVGGCDLSLWQAKRQYALNRQLIAALEHYDNKQALTLVNQGADPNTRQNPPPPPTLKLLLNQLLHCSPASDNDSPAALRVACGDVFHSTNSTFFIVGEGSENVFLVQAMLTHGANVHELDENGDTPLHSAAGQNHVSVVDMLLKYNADVNAQNTNGNTPLMFAQFNDDVGITRLLLQHGANPNLPNVSGETALHYAVRHSNDVTYIRELLTHGADPNVADKNGDTAIMLAKKVGRPDLVALLRGKR